MNKYLLAALLMAGGSFGAYAIYQTEMPKSDEVSITDYTIDSIDKTGSRSDESSKRLLYAGNVPCNPAKKVCED